MSAIVSNGKPAMVALPYCLTGVDEEVVAVLPNCQWTMQVKVEGRLHVPFASLSSALNPRLPFSLLRGALDLS